MKKIQYLSPTSIASFQADLTEFYLSYLADRRPPRIPQTRPMSVGSSFDAYVKSHLHYKLFGKIDPKFELTAIFEAQVEVQNRDWALIAGKNAFDQYVASGALADLVLELEGAVGTPRFELEVRGVVNGHREGMTKDVGDVTFLGKPDLFFMNRGGAHVIHDWKVNGYCGSYTTTPMPGYVRLRDRDDMGRYFKAKAHKDAILMPHHGLTINMAGYLEIYNEEWARQLSVYAWLLGEDIGSDFIVSVDQLACKPGVGGVPQIRVAEHRLRVGKEFQWKTFVLAQEIWSVVHSDHIFRDLSKEDSKARCELLDGTAEALVGEGTSMDAWFSDACRQPKPYKS